MKKTVIAIALCLGMAALSACQSGSPVTGSVSSSAEVSGSAAARTSSSDARIIGNTVQVSGQGKVVVTPDLAQVSVGVDTRSRTADESQKQNASQVNALIDHLKSLGIPEEKIQTSGYYLNAEYDWENGNNEIVGYTASTTLTISEQPVSDVGKIVAESVSSGANRFHGISFTASDYDTRYAEALADGVASSRIKAESLAAAAGKKLGAILTMTEGSGSSSPYMPADYFVEESAKAASDMAVLPGEMQILAPVTITYALEG